LKRLLRLRDRIGEKGEKLFTTPFSFPMCDYYKPRDENDRTLVFESRFESGNLQLAQKKDENEYDLVL